MDSFPQNPDETLNPLAAVTEPNPPLAAVTEPNPPLAAVTEPNPLAQNTVLVPNPYEKVAVPSSSAVKLTVRKRTRGEVDVQEDVVNLKSDDKNDLAIVAVTNQEESSSSAVKVAQKKKRLSHPKLLVRIKETSEDGMRSREVVRKTRMIYASLLVFFNIEEEEEREGKALDGINPVDENEAENEDENENENEAENEAEIEAPVAEIEAPVAENEAPVAGKKNPRRGDLRAAKLMRDNGLCLKSEKKIIGAIPGISIGDVFFFRTELQVIGLHNQIQAGIGYLPMSNKSYDFDPIATSVIVSDGYDNIVSEDGAEITYIGQGGKLKNGQKCDQLLEGGNLAMVRSHHHKIEVRVIRGMKYEGRSTKGKVYVYDGLYEIANYSFGVPSSGSDSKVYKFKLVRIKGQPEAGSAILKKMSGINFDPRFCFSDDISNKLERLPVSVFNSIDQNKDPLFCKYLVKTTPPSLYSEEPIFCNCLESCDAGCLCAMKNGGRFPYDKKGNLISGKGYIYECGESCRCPPSCRNRVTQKGFMNRLQVFRKEEGWGVWSLDIIHAGAFICEYSGILLTREQAQIMEKKEVIYHGQFPKRWEEWGDLTKIYPNSRGRSHPPNVLDVCLDVTEKRNVASYMSHSSTPNVFVQYVIIDRENLKCPRLMLFAMENIPPMRELKIDYGISDDYTGKRVD